MDLCGAAFIHVGLCLVFGPMHLIPTATDLVQLIVKTEM
jgi:hypothetical protein